MNTMNRGDQIVVAAGKEEDHFNSLPDALILVIFSKVIHAKYLFRCFSVCKRFASLLPQTHTVFISIRLQNHHNPISTLFQNMVKKPLRFFYWMVPSWSSPSSSSSSLIMDNFAPPHSISNLKKFSCVRSLQIQLQPTANSDYSVYGPWIKFKAVIGARLEIAVFILALDFHKMQGFNGATLPTDAGPDDFMEGRILTVIKGRLGNALGFHRLAQSLVFDLHALCELVISDERGGELFMGKEQIVELRNNILGTESELSVSEIIGGDGIMVKTWRAPVVLELPSSGCVMEWATVAVVKSEDEEIWMERDVDLILGAFKGKDDDEHGKAIDEVVHIMKEMSVANNQDEASIKTHRLQVFED